MEAQGAPEGLCQSLELVLGACGPAGQGEVNPHILGGPLYQDCCSPRSSPALLLQVLKPSVWDPPACRGLTCSWKADSGACGEPTNWNLPPVCQVSTGTPGHSSLAGWGGMFAQMMGFGLTSDLP